MLDGIGTNRDVIRSLRIPGAVIALVLLAIAVHFWRQVQADTRRKEAWHRRPVIEDYDVSEVGYISEVRSRLLFGEHRRDVTWWVKIPATGALYNCEWEAGSPEFRKGDDVTLIHTKDDSDSGDSEGYVIGLDGRGKGKTVLVNVADEEELLMNSQE